MGYLVQGVQIRQLRPIVLSRIWIWSFGYAACAHLETSNTFILRTLKIQISTHMSFLNINIFESPKNDIDGFLNLPTSELLN